MNDKKMSEISKDAKIRFIKLGDGGEWEKSCIADNTIRLGYRSRNHQDCLDGKWDKVRKEWTGSTNIGAITRHINQVKAFYKSKENDIWITFYKRKLYWGRAGSEVIQRDDKSKVRKIIDNWSCTDINGQKELNFDNLDGRVTKSQGFRGTICKARLQNYLINKINGKTDPVIEEVEKNINSLKENIKKLIKGLHWKDFELLADLIFSNAGWQRVTTLGKTTKDIDLDLAMPISQKRIFVQVKSEASRDTFEDYINKFNEYEIYDEMYFVVHTSGDGLKSLENENITLIDMDKLPELVVNAGLIGWLIEKRS